MPEHDFGQQAPQPAAPTAPQHVPTGANPTPATAPAPPFAAPATATAPQFATPATASAPQFAAPATASAPQFATPATASAPQYAPPAPPAQQFAAPAFPAPQFAPPPAASAYAPASSQAKRSSSNRTVTWIVVGSILVFAVFIAAIVALVVFITGALNEQEKGEPLVAGGSPTTEARAPLDCESECLLMNGPLLFSTDFIDHNLIADRSLAYPSTVEYEHGSMITSFDDLGGTPAQCSFVYSVSPVTLDTLGAEATTESIQVHEPYSDADGATYFQQSTRVFSSSADAVTYMQQLETELAACPRYSTDGSLLPAVTSVESAASLSVPDSVANLGWVELGTDARYYAIDLQRGNVVIRSGLTSSGDMTEQEFRDLVSITAQRFAALAVTND